MNLPTTALGCPNCGGTCQALRGLGCACSQGMGAVVDYDIVTIGGKQYTVNQILDKTIIANRDVVLYPSLFNDTGKFTVKAGQTIGKAFSYLLPSNKSNPTGKVVIIFERAYNVNYYLKDDNAISTQALKDQGALTLKQEAEAEADRVKREADPLGYYLEKYALKALLIGGVIYLAATYGKEFLRQKMAMNGTPDKKESTLSMTKELNKLKAQRNRAKKGSKKRALLIDKIDKQSQKIIDNGGDNFKPRHAANYEL